MKAFKLIPILLISLIIFSCQKKEKKVELNLEKVDGFVQKGPFLNGTSITLHELTDNLDQTGRSFSSQIVDNTGTFEVEHVYLISPYVELKADGFYFNEVSNSNSSAQLTLYALSNLSNESSLNVNILSTLEKNRVEYLLSEGTSFSDAKKQAQSEILSIFEINDVEISKSEHLDITKSGDDNAILLAISVILQGYLPVSELSELLANMSTDIRTDGILNSKSLSSTLINNAKTIKLDEIRTNLEKRYESMGLTVTVPNFEKYVNQFIENTDFEFTGFIQYPSEGKYGLNVLDKEKIDYEVGTYSMKAFLPDGNNLKVKVRGDLWGFIPNHSEGWEFSEWNKIEMSRIFTATKTGEIDLKFEFENVPDSTSNKIIISAYENDDLEPTWSKEIVVK